MPGWEGRQRTRRFRRRASAARHRARPDAFWHGVADIFARFAPENRGAAGKRDEIQAQDRRLARARAAAARPGRIPGLPARDRLSRRRARAVHDRHRECRRGDRDDSPGRSWSCRCSTPASCSTPPMPAGAASTTRSTAPTRCPARRPGRRLRRRARRAGDRLGARPSSTRPCRWPAGCWAISRGAPDLADPAQLVGSRADDDPAVPPQRPAHRVVIDREHPIGRDRPGRHRRHRAESALTTIVDLEDSIAAVDAEDKVAAYRNWLGLMSGDLIASFDKGGRTMTRRSTTIALYRAGRQRVDPARPQPAVRAQRRPPDDHAGGPAAGRRGGARRHSRRDRHQPDRAARPQAAWAATATAAPGSIYIVKPKMHGPDEAAFTNRLFDAVEDLLGLPRHTIKVGVMDEERRTSRQSRRLHPCGAAAASCSSTPASSTAWMQAARLARSAPLLVHHADLDRVTGKAEQILHSIEQPVGEGGFLRPVHFRLDDVDRAGAAVAQRPSPSCRGAPIRLVTMASRMPSGASDPSGQQDRRRGHQMADIAHEQQAAAGQRQRAAIRAV